MIQSKKKTKQKDKTKSRQKCSFKTRGNDEKIKPRKKKV
jgi:hypothetical protein